MSNGQWIPDYKASFVENTKYFVVYKQNNILAKPTRFVWAEKDFPSEKIDRKIVLMPIDNSHAIMNTGTTNAPKTTETKEPIQAVSILPNLNVNLPS